MRARSWRGLIGMRRFGRRLLSALWMVLLQEYSYGSSYLRSWSLYALALGAACVGVIQICQLIYFSATSISRNRSTTEQGQHENVERSTRLALPTENLCRNLLARPSLASTKAHLTCTKTHC